MHARQTTVQADPSNVDSAIQRVRDDVMPALQASDGFKGFTLLVDREAGTLVGTSYFESREALDASEEAVRGPREETARTAGAADVDVRLFEVAIDTEA